MGQSTAGLGSASAQTPSQTRTQSGGAATQQSDAPVPPSNIQNPVGGGTPDEVIENGKLTVYVKGYGAVGDGRTDDGKAIGNAIQRAINYTYANPSQSAVVQFESNRTYKIETVPVSMSSYNAALSLVNAKNVTLQGSNTTIIGDPDKAYLQVSSGSNITLSGFNFNLEKPVAVTAEVIAKNGSTVDFKVPFKFDFSGNTYDFANGSNGGTVFAIPANGARDHSFFTQMTRLTDTTYRVAFTSGGYTIMNPGTKVYLPVPEYGFKGTAFSIISSENVTLKDCQVWNAGQFVFQINNNPGNITFQNVKVVPQNSSACETVAWRDCIHAKDNRGKLTFDGCQFQGCHDDIFNISNTLMKLTEVAGDKYYRVQGMDYGPSGAFVNLRAGDTLVMLNNVTGELYGTTTITEVVRQYGGDIQIKVKDSLPGVGVGTWMYVEELASPGSVIRNGKFSGSFRIRGSTTIQNSSFEVLAMWTAYENIVEGPIPKDIQYTGCTFTRKVAGTGARMTFDCLCSSNQTPEYAVSNIVFSNCKFQDGGMLQQHAGVTVK